jgi:hypothetical protein
MSTQLNAIKISNRRLFDIKQECERIHGCLTEFRDKNLPGHQFEWGSKTLVLLKIKDEIQSLFDDGYTVQQIAAAISNGGFSILPKTITQILNDKPKTELSTKIKTRTKSKPSKTRSGVKAETKRETNSYPAPDLTRKPTTGYEDVE